MNIDEQCTLFDDFWLKFSGQIRTGSTFDPFINGTNRPQFLTLVSRLPVAIAENVSRELEAVSSVFPEFYYYPAREIHFTLNDITGLLASSPDPSNDAVAAALFNELARLFAHSRPGRLHARSLGIFPTSIFVELLDPDQWVGGMRAVVADTVARLTDVEVTPLPAPGVAFANVARFTAPPDVRLVELLEGRRTRAFGEFDIVDFELVLTDKVLSDRNTIVYRTMPLDGLKPRT